jgi:MbtH protein
VLEGFGHAHARGKFQLYSKERKTSRDETEGRTTYEVVVNHEEQYSIWPVDREHALGRSGAGKGGAQGGCMNYIN